MSETITLDPAEETTGRVEFDLTPFIGPGGPDFGDAQIEAYMAEASRGQIPVDYRLPNRTITIPLNLFEHGPLSYDDVRTMVQAKVGLWQREGGVLKRDIDGTAWYADVVNATLKMGGSTAQALLDIDADAVLTLDAIPDWYGDEIDLRTATGTGEVTTLLEPGKGDHDGRVRIVATDTASQPRLGVMWGLRSRHYSSDATAALAYEAEDLTPLDQAAVATVTGASGGASNNAVSHNAVPTIWTPVLSLEIDGVGPMTHSGTYRVWARAHGGGLVGPRLRLAWAVGEFRNPTFNPATTTVDPYLNRWYLVDLGAVRLDAAPTGTHRWYGQIQAISIENALAGVSIDKVWLQPMEKAGVLRAALRADVGMDGFAASDGFDQSSGNLTGKTLPVGGTWTVLSGSVDADDFTLDTTLAVAQRTAVSDAIVGRLISAGTTTFTDVAAQVDMQVSANIAGLDQTLLLRAADASHYLEITVQTNGPLNSATIEANTFSAGRTVLALEREIPYVVNAWYTLRAQVDTGGRLLVWWTLQGSQFGDPVLTAYSSALATGGTRASGMVGLRDYYNGAAALTRRYDNFAVWVPKPDAVINAGRSLELRHDGVWRSSADGNGITSVSSVVGDLPRLPPPGLEGRVSELTLVASRGDFDQLADITRADGFSVQVLYRPSFLFVPDGGPGS